MNGNECVEETYPGSDGPTQTGVTCCCTSQTGSQLDKLPNGAGLKCFENIDVAAKKLQIKNYGCFHRLSEFRLERSGTPIQHRSN